MQDIIHITSYTCSITLVVAADEHLATQLALTRVVSMCPWQAHAAMRKHPACHIIAARHGDVNLQHMRNDFGLRGRPRRRWRRCGESRRTTS